MFDSLSVIIPTYNRRDVLLKALEAYRVQSASHMIHELLVVDDGSTDDTESVVREYAGRAPFQVRYLRQRNQGQATARNYGIREAQSNLVLFTDSDIIPGRDLVEQHIQWHNANPRLSTAVLGYVTWSPEVKATPFMRWYGEEALLGYRFLRGRREADFRFFYTCNLSLKTEYLRTCGQFDEEFKTYGWEDIELGYRLTQKGLQMLYNRDAIAYHYQFVSFEDACRKAAKTLEARRIFDRKEAGRYWLAEQSNRTATVRFRVVTWLEAGVASIFRLSKRLPDSRLPLPSRVYRCLYSYATNSRVATETADAKEL
jgi:GT2 family glycosyltransferase